MDRKIESPPFRVSFRFGIEWYGVMLVTSILGSCFGSHFAEAAIQTIMAGRAVSVEGKVLIRQDGTKESLAISLKPGMAVKEGDVLNTSSNGKAKLLLEDKSILDIGPSALFKVEKFVPKNGADRDVGLSMPYGTTRVSVTQPLAPGGKFQIRTRTATMGVRGTEFIIQSVLTTPKEVTGQAPPSRSESATAGKPGAGQSSNGTRVTGTNAAALPQNTKITVIEGKVEVVQKLEPTLLPGRAPAAAAAASVPPPILLTAGTQLTTSLDAVAAKPITLDRAQLVAVASSNTVVDNTFQKAVVLDLKPESGGGAVDSGLGQATRQAISQAISAPQNQVTTVPTSGFIGVPSQLQTPVIKPVTIQAGGVYNVHITVTR